MEFRFGPDNVFFDREDIKPGDTFDERIRAQLEDADVVLAVIGPRWVDAADKSGNQRLKNPHDWVALELRTALEDDKHIIPVLVDDAQPPRADALPEPLRPLANIHAHSISPHSTPGDITELIGFIEKASTGEDPEGAITFLFTDI